MGIARRYRLVTALVTAAVLLALLDAGLGTWQPRAARLPGHFSKTYLDRRIDAFVGKSNVILALGDSIVWGYKVPIQTSAVALLRTNFPDANVLNLSVVGATPATVDMLLRYVLARGLRPKLVLFDINQLAFNPAYKSYARIEGDVVPAAAAVRQASDTGRLRNLPATTALNDRLDAWVRQHWALYGLRLDLHQAIFGDADAAGALRRFETRVTRRLPEGGPAVADEFSGTIDLSPLDDANVSFWYLKRSIALARNERIAIVAFIAPANHRLMHLDFPEYHENIRALSGLAAPGVTIANFENAVPASHLFDHTHPDVTGHRLLATLLQPLVRKAMRAF